MTKEKIGFKCCICHRHCYGWGDKKQYGNNPAPVKNKGECCNDCNAQIVIPARFAGMVVKK
jgi:hypothetical protein